MKSVKSSFFAWLRVSMGNAPFLHRYMQSASPFFVVGYRAWRVSDIL
jgi:hypothetical protein